MDVRQLVAWSVAVGSLVVGLPAGSAFAQAPGEVVAPADDASAPPAYEQPAPMVIQIARPSVMDDRWSVGLSLGSMTLSPDGSHDQTGFGIGELALRFRATPHLELEASAGGGRQQLDNGDPGDLQVNTAALALRYRLFPESAWNCFVMAGIGGASVTFHDATDQQRDDATHALAMLGVGVERRFHHFALQAELRAVSIAGSHPDDKMAESAPVSGTITTPSPSPATDKLTGGSLTIGASYYF
jgi:hypothetical protein